MVQSAGAFTREVKAMREVEPEMLVKGPREFFKSFKNSNFKDHSTAHIQKMVDADYLSVSNLLSGCTKKQKNLKS